MSITFTEYITLQKIECGGCGGVFALCKNFVETKKRESGGFTCPYCSQKRGWWTSKAEELEKELEQKRRELTAARCEILAEKNKLQSLQKNHNRLVKTGICPCCRRSFINLKRHMKTKHPEYVK